MNCSRCDGLMVGDDLIDVRESYLPMWTQGLRCVACGNIVDPVIARNRKHQLAGVGLTREVDGQASVSPQHARAA